MYIEVSHSHDYGNVGPFVSLGDAFSYSIMYLRGCAGFSSYEFDTILVNDKRVVKIIREIHSCHCLVCQYCGVEFIHVRSLTSSSGG